MTVRPRAGSVAGVVEGLKATGVRRPAVWALALLGVGLLVGRGYDVSAFMCFGVAGAGAALSFVTRGWLCRLLLAAAVVAFGMGWWTRRCETPPPLGALLIEAQRTPITVEGEALDHARPGPGAAGRFGAFLPERDVTRVRLRVDALVTVSAAGDKSSERTKGELLVLIDGPAELRAGERVRITGMAAPVEPPLNPGEFDFRPWAAQQGVAGRLFVSNQALIEKVSGDAQREAWLGFRADVRARATRLLGDSLDALGPAEEGSAAGRALLAAMLLGERAPALRDTENAFTRLGVVHIVAISGVNLTILAWAALLAVRLTGDRGRLEPLLVAGVVLLYLVVVPAQTPIVRAGAMVLALLVAEALGRRYDRLNTLAWVAVGILIWRPLELWSPGFQLSFGVVAALLTLTRPVTGRWFGPRPDPDHSTLAQRAVYAGKEAVVASIVAWAVATPTIMAHFAIFSPLAPIVTLVLAIPAGVMLVGGYMSMLLSAVFPSVGYLAGPALEGLAGAIAGATTALDRLPGAMIHTPLVGPVWAGAATVVIVWWLRSGVASASDWWRTPLPEGSPLPTKPRPSRDFLAAAGLVVGALGVAGLDTNLDARTELRMDTLAVGDGTCHVLRAPAGFGRAEAILWDCGASSLTFGERTLPAIVRALGVQRGVVPAAIITHPNLDHYSALPDAVETLGVRTVYLGESFEKAAAAAPHGPAAHLLERLRARGVEIRVVVAGDTLELGESTIEFLSPTKGSEWHELNDTSLVARITAPSGRRVVMTGDIDKPAMVDMTTRGVDYAADVMEAPHHGAATHPAFEFVTRAGPTVVVQSTGPRRVGDERWDRAKTGRRWFATAADGLITVEIKEDGDIGARSYLGVGVRR